MDKAGTPTEKVIDIPKICSFVEMTTFVERNYGDQMVTQEDGRRVLTREFEAQKFSLTIREGEESFIALSQSEQQTGLTQITSVKYRNHGMNFEQAGIITLGINNEIIDFSGGRPVEIYSFIAQTLIGSQEVHTIEEA